MVRFGHRSLRQEPVVRGSSYLPGNLYRNSSRKEVDADGDIDELIAQEIQRYEELFQPGGNRDCDDDDTMQDGSIYTSMQASLVQAQAQGILHPLCAQANVGGCTSAKTPQGDLEDSEEEDTSMWGLENPPFENKNNNNNSAVQTSLLKPHEAAAAQACAVKASSPVTAKATLHNSKNSKTSFVPPVPVLPIDQQQAAAEEDVPATPPPVPAKKNKKKPSLKRLFHVKSSLTGNTVPSTPTPTSSQPPPQASATNKASTTTAPTTNKKIKNKFFTPAKKFFHHHHSSKAAATNNNGKPRNLVMAVSSAPPKNATKNNHHKKAGPSSPPQPTTPSTTPAKHDINMTMTTSQQQRRPSTPPPPMDHCEIQFGDGASVISTMTEAMEGWMLSHSSSPPKLIGGGAMASSPFSGKNISPIKFDVYEGGMMPYRHSGADDGDDDDEEEEQQKGTDDEASEASPGALLLTAEGLYFHNHHGQTFSPVRIVRSSSDLSPSSSWEEIGAANAIQNNLVKMVWADKEQRELLKETKALMHSDVIPEDADHQDYHNHVLGLRHHHYGHGGHGVDPTVSVKRNLFGDDNDIHQEEDDTQMDVSLAPLQHVITAVDEEEEDNAEDVVTGLEADDVPMDDEKVAFALQQVEYNSAAREQGRPKPSKFKRFLSKLVTNNHSPKMKQQQQEAQVKLLLEHERLKAKEALLERQRMEREETQRIQQKRQQELERQRKLELGSHDEPQSQTSNTGNSTGTYEDSDHLHEEVIKPRSFSLLTGEMKPEPHHHHHHGSQSSYTADITSSFPTVNTPSLSSLIESPKPSSTTPCDEAVPASPAYTSTLVNFQFHRQDGDKYFTMSFCVDTSEQVGMKWKDVVNRAWKKDRKVCKSGVFSAIELERIYLIREGMLEMRFELPFWGKHASQTLGPKTLDLLLDVVGPQRPVMVTITLEEPHLAAGVDDEEAMAALFQNESTLVS